MGVSIANWRVRIGLFNCNIVKKIGVTSSSSSISNDLLLIILFLKLCSSVAFLFLSSLFFVAFLIIHSKSTFLFYHIFSQYSLVECFSHCLVIPAYTLKLNTRISNIPALACNIPKICLIAATINSMLLLLAGIERNPGPMPGGKLSFANWNVNSLLARQRAKLPIIEALQASTDFHIFSICESWLNEKISAEKIKIAGFGEKPLRADCPEASIHPRGGFLLYFKEDLPLIPRNDLCFLKECIVAEIKLSNNKKIFFTVLYRSPSQSSAELKEFIKNLEKNHDSHKQ